MIVMYIRKSIADFLEKMPKKMELPRDWRLFVKRYDIEYNLIIKHGKEYECTNCGKYFYSEQDIREGYRDICPFCNNKYDVRRSNLKNYTFKYDLAVLDNIDNKLIIRYFEVERIYDYKIRKFKDDIVEYARIVPELDLELASDRFIKYMGVEKVYHTKRIKKWRIFTGQYGMQQYYKAIYIDNIDKKIRGTIYQYAQLKEAIEYLKNDKVDFLKLLEKAKYPSFELLMKAGLYKLAIESPEKFNEKGSFEKRFGIEKSYYEFMKKYNVDFKELSVLKITKIKNINKIRDVLKMWNIEDIKRVSKYVKLFKLKEYSKSQKNFSLPSYLDYIRNLQKLNVPIRGNKILYPENFIEAHDEITKKVKTICDNDETINNMIMKRYKKLEKNQYNDNIIFIRPANSINDLKDEAIQQNNCVYRNYTEDYAFGETDIYFLRYNKEPAKSAVTIEVRDREIRQKEQKNHSPLTSEQKKALKYWKENILDKVA